MEEYASAARGKQMQSGLHEKMHIPEMPLVYCRGENRANYISSGIEGAEARAHPLGNSEKSPYEAETILDKD